MTVTNSGDNKNYTIIVNSVQYCILMLFNDVDSMPYSEIENKFKNTKDVLNAMKQLCNPKISILKKEVKKPVFAPGEMITINKGYKNKVLRFNAAPPRQRPEAPKNGEKDPAIEALHRMRLEVVKAHFVKQMKANGQSKEGYAYSKLEDKLMSMNFKFRIEKDLIKKA